MSTIENVQKRIDSFKLSNDQPVDIHFWNKSQFGLHTHSHYEILILIKGKAVHQLNDHPKILKPQSLVLIQPDDTHKLDIYKEYASEHVNIAISKDLFNEICDSVNKYLLNYIKTSIFDPYISLKKEDFEYVLYLANKINLINSQNTHKLILIAKQIIFNILTVFAHLINQPKTEHPAWLHEFLEKINTPEFFLKPTSELYKYAPYAQSKLSRYFKQYVGTTLIGYITSEKINYACGLLKNTNLSVLEISSRLNYDSLAHFNRVFKKTTGKTPREYRISHSI